MERRFPRPVTPAGEPCVHQRPGIVHCRFDYSPDMEYLEVVAPADFKTVEVAGPRARASALAVTAAGWGRCSELHVQLVDLLDFLTGCG